MKSNMISNIKSQNFNYDYFIQTLDQKKYFLAQVYATLIFEIFIAYIVLMYAENRNITFTRVQYICLIIFTFLTLISIVFIDLPFIKFILFTLFSGLIGLLFSTRIDLKNGENATEENDIVKKAFITTCSIFVYLTIFGFFAAFMGARISPVVSITLFFLLLLLIIVIFILSIAGTYMMYRKIIAGFIILLFSLFIIYDTISILDRNYAGDFITAAIDYFLDFINIFSALIGLN
jgi:FtsH-binding integral membrane protein